LNFYPEMSHFVHSANDGGRGPLDPPLIQALKERIWLYK